jgi:hypothetical protein
LQILGNSWYLGGLDTPDGGEGHYLDDRARALAQSYTVDEAKEGIRLVAAEVGFYDKTVHILAKVKKETHEMGEGNHKILYCIMRLKPTAGLGMPSVEFFSGVVNLIGTVFIDKMPIDEDMLY